MDSPTYQMNGVTIAGTGSSLNTCNRAFDRYGNLGYEKNGRFGADVNLLANTVRLPEIVLPEPSPILKIDVEKITASMYVFPQLECSKKEKNKLFWLDL